MNKISITRFIEKYYLNGNCSSVSWVSDGSKLSTRFITGDKNLLGELSMKNFSFDNVEMGVYNTEQLVKLLSVLSDNIIQKNFLVRINKETKPLINKKSDEYKKYYKKANAQYIAKIYKSYDKYINENYKIDINQRVLERLKNSF